MCHFTTVFLHRVEYILVSVFDLALSAKWGVGVETGGKIAQILVECIMQRLGTTEIFKVFGFIEDQGRLKLSLVVLFPLRHLALGIKHI